MSAASTDAVTATERPTVARRQRNRTDQHQDDCKNVDRLSIRLVVRRAERTHELKRAHAERAQQDGAPRQPHPQDSTRGPVGRHPPSGASITTPVGVEATRANASSQSGGKCGDLVDDQLRLHVRSHADIPGGIATDGYEVGRIFRRCGVDQ